MERVVTINLNGNSYQLEEPAYDALRAYLSRAGAALGDNPDKAEIIRDLEQAIADKCSAYLGAHKSVVNAGEMSRVLEEMGPVQGAGEPASEQPHSDQGPYEPRKRLYRIKDGAQISGVSTGIAAYFDLDVNIVRLLWIVAALFTSGAAVILYIAMMFMVPSAHTSAEWAAAHGVPFNAQEVIDRAKREYSKVAEETSRAWRRERRAWRRQERQWDWGWGGPPPQAPQPTQPVGYVTRMFAGLFAFIFSIITAALLIAFLLAFFSLLGAGTILGWGPPEGVPLWLAVVVLCIAYAAISSPFSAMRRSSYATLSGYRASPGGGFADGLISLAIAGIAIWFAWMFWPAGREVIEGAYLVLRDFAEHWNALWFDF